jgi:tRNA (guanosine-2'-O-)-methyltransferase
MRPARKEKLTQVAHRRQGNLTVLLENVHDPHNIGAVMRSCDSVGIREFYVLYTEPHLTRERLALGKRTSAGARKWLDIHLYNDPDACFKDLRANYETILCTHLGESAQNLYQLDLTRSVVLVFGNERDGVSQDLLDRCDGNFLIPQMGMAGSLNISVACAVTLYEACRQRHEKGFYQDNPTLSPAEKEALAKEYFQRHEAGSSPHSVEARKLKN